MSLQAFLDNETTPFIRAGLAATDQTGILLQDAGRAEGAIFQFTVMAFNPTSKKYTPYVNAGATNGENVPAGIQLNGDITQQATIDGDVVDFMVLIADAYFDENQIVFDANGSIPMDTVGTVATGAIKTVRQLLLDIGLIAQSTIDTSSFENS